MSTAKLNVWITARSDACHIDDQDSWFVHITDCRGRVLEWCGRKFSFIPAKCGHAEIEVPPGCYTVFAGHSAGPGTRPPFGNRLTHVQVVRANCGDHVCVTLFSPSMWHCGTWFAHAIRTQMEGLEAGGIDAELAHAAVDAVLKFTDALQPDPYVQRTLFAFEDERPKDERPKDEGPKQQDG